MKQIIAVDPGRDGGMALMVLGDIIEWTKMPATTSGIVHYIDSLLIHYHTPILVVEYQQPMPQKGYTSVKATANMMRAFGRWEALAAVYRMPYLEVTPSVWKKAMGVTKDKATSIELCERLFPRINLVQTGCRKKHDGIAEACLIAEYARRVNL